MALASSHGHLQPVITPQAGLMSPSVAASPTSAVGSPSKSNQAIARGSTKCEHSSKVSSGVLGGRLRKAFRMCSLLIVLRAKAPNDPAGQHPVCCMCRDSYRLHFSLADASIVCWRSSCLKAHAAKSIDSCPVFVDMKLLEVRCATCSLTAMDGDADMIRKIEFTDACRAANLRLPAPWVTASHSAKAYKGLPPATVQAGLKGMFNAGNSCYISAVLQCLLHSQDLREYFLSGKHKQAQCNYKTPDGSPCMACQIDDVTNQLYGSKLEIPVILPANFIHATWLNCKDLAGGEQHDAHELYIRLLDALSSALSGSTKGSATVPPAPLPLAGPANNGDSKGVPHARTIVQESFEGKLQSVLLCQKCGSKRQMEDPFLDLALQVAEDERGQVSLMSCLRQFTQPEKIHDNQCHQCGSNDIHKQLNIQQLPKVLCLQIKRFKAMGSSFGKINTHVAAPPVIDMTPFLTTSAQESSNGRRMKLRSFVAHTGTMDTGHYTTYLKEGGTWILLDDAHVRTASLAEANAAPGYLFFYDVL